MHGRLQASDNEHTLFAPRIIAFIFWTSREERVPDIDGAMLRGVGHDATYWTIDLQKDGGDRLRRWRMIEEYISPGDNIGHSNDGRLVEKTALIDYSKATEVGVNESRACE